MRDLREDLRAYAAAGWYPFHMPGHKRRADSPAGPDAAIDITEIDGFDDLHHPAGILAEMQCEAARICGSGECRFLVNGSTAGILAAVRAAVPKGGRVLIDRRCHISVYHAMILGELVPRYLFPETDPLTEIAFAPSAEDVRRALEKDPEIRTVIITSPSYEGIAADVRGIAEAVHAHDACLIVDEAHGAHLPFMNRIAGGTVLRFPESAVTAGADLVVQSLHKTMPALTQCALLHRCSGRVPQERIDAALRIFQTSSPSYVLMASIGNALRDAEERPEQFSAYAARLSALREGLAECRRAVLFGGASGRGPERGIRRKANFETDPGKIVLCCRGAAASHGEASGKAMSGRGLYDILRERYLLQPEMFAGRYALLMTSPADTDEGFARLLEAVREIDAELMRGNMPAGLTECRDLPACGEIPERGEMQCEGAAACVPEQVMTPAEADAAGADGDRTEYMAPEEAAGRICADFIYRYPPGIPILVPGERIGAEAIRDMGRTDIKGLRGGKVRVLHG